MARSRISRQVDTQRSQPLRLPDRAEAYTSNKPSEDTLAVPSLRRLLIGAPRLTAHSKVRSMLSLIVIHKSISPQST